MSPQNRGQLDVSANQTQTGSYVLSKSRYRNNHQLRSLPESSLSLRARCKALVDHSITRLYSESNRMRSNTNIIDILQQLKRTFRALHPETVTMTD
jgi:hypothetical protein